MADLQGRYDVSFDTCMRREMRGRDEEAASLAIDEVPENRRRHCERKALSGVRVEDHYFGERHSTYPQERRHWYCTYYCQVVGLDGRCDSVGAELPKAKYRDFLASQARYGDLLSRLDSLPDY